MKASLRFILAFLVLLAGQTYAQQTPRHPRDPHINQRQQQQAQRINQGRKSGQLTPEEAKQLRQSEKNVRQEEQAAKSDGNLTKSERKDLHQDLNNLSQDIYHEKHDGETLTNTLK